MKSEVSASCIVPNIWLKTKAHCIRLTAFVYNQRLITSLTFFCFQTYEICRITRIFSGIFIQLKGI